MPRFSNFMERFTPRQLLLLCCAIALVVFLLIYFMLTRLTAEKPKPAPAQPANVQIVVAQTDIAPRTVIRENMLQLREMPANAVPAGAARRTTDLIGKPAKEGIVQGEIITRQKMYSSMQDAGLSGRIPPDCRAITVGISDVTGVAGFAQPGDYVDVMLVSSQVEPNKVTSELVLQNVLLLAINKSANQPSSTPPPQNNANNQNQGQQQGQAQPAANNNSVRAVGNPATATLALTPEDTLKLAAKAQLGQLYLALRPFRPAVPNSEETYYSVTKASGRVQAPPTGVAPIMPDDPTGNVQVIRGTTTTVGR